MLGAYLGEVLALVAAGAFAGANYCVSRTTQSKGDKGTMFSVFVTLVMSLGLWVVTGREGVSGNDWQAGVLWFISAGLGAMLLGRSFLFASVRRLGVARSSAVKRLNPFFSVILAAGILGELISPLNGFGMLLIGISFVILLLERKSNVNDTQARAPADYVTGVLAALCYALAYIARKLGLDAMPSPMLGTFISAASGFAAFGVAAAFSKAYRDKFLNMFSYLDRWIFTAAVLMSAGQILFFTALAVENVSTVVMIASLEILIAILLSSVVFRTEPLPSKRILLAALLAFIGVCLVAN